MNMFGREHFKEIFQFKVEDQFRLTQGRWIKCDETRISWLYFVFKFCMAAYVMTFYGWSLMYNTKHWFGPKYFIYYAQWCYATLAIWVIIDFGLVAKRMKSQISSDYEDFTSHFGVPRIHQLLWYMTNLSHCLALTVSMGYCNILYLKNIEKIYMFSLVNLYVLQTVLVILDTIFSSKPKNIFHFWPALLFTAFYLMFDLIYVKAGGKDPDENHYIHPGMSWNDNFGIAFLKGMGLLALSIVSHFILCILVFVRDKLWQKFNQKAEKYEELKSRYENIPIKQSDQLPYNPFSLEHDSDNDLINEIDLLIQKPNVSDAYSDVNKNK